MIALGLKKVNIARLRVTTSLYPNSLLHLSVSKLDSSIVVVAISVVVSSSDKEFFAPHLWKLVNMYSKQNLSNVSLFTVL